MLGPVAFSDARQIVSLLRQIQIAIGKKSDEMATSPTDEASLIAIAKGIFSNPSTSGSTSTISAEISVLDTILFKAPNWNFLLDDGEWIWRSRGNESDTGRLDIGYIKLAKSLQLVLGGGGGTNGNLKKITIKEKGTNTVLVSKNLGEVMNADTNGLQLSSLIDTTTYAGKTAYLSFEDNDAGSSWSWFKFHPLYAIIYDLT